MSAKRCARLASLGEKGGLRQRYRMLRLQSHQVTLGLAQQQVPRPTIQCSLGWSAWAQRPALQLADTQTKWLHVGTSEHPLRWLCCPLEHIPVPSQRPHAVPSRLMRPHDVPPGSITGRLRVSAVPGPQQIDILHSPVNCFALSPSPVSVTESSVQRSTTWGKEVNASGPVVLAGQPPALLLKVYENSRMQFAALQRMGTNAE
jgi:hypothetical protein